MLAPLFDRMLTHDLKRRFTADEALEFFQNEYSKLTEQQLNCLTYSHPFQDGSYIDCWNRIPPHLAEKWACHRLPPVPWSYPFLRWLWKKRRMEHVLPWIRLFFSLIISPRRALKSLQVIFVKRWSWISFPTCCSYARIKIIQVKRMFISCHHFLPYFRNVSNPEKRTVTLTLPAT